MINLKNQLLDIDIKQIELAKHLGISGAAVCLILRHDVWPKKKHEELKSRTCEFLRKHGLDETAISIAFDEADPVDSTRQSAANEVFNIEENDEMLLRKYVLTPAARKAFGFFKDPFTDVESSEQVFMTPDSRYVREALRATVRHGGFIAVVGESGAGKSTLRRDLMDWIANNFAQTSVIEPYVLGMEDNDIQGKSLKASHIAEAIMGTIAPGQHVLRSAESRFGQVHRALRESHRAGNNHVLVIEEAHSLPIPTLKHLKRFFELEDGFAKLLSIVLIGQTELAHKLDERNPNVREVVQRCELVTLQALGNELEGYLDHRFSQHGKNAKDVLESEAIDALRLKLSGRSHSLLFPLAVNNVLTAAMNNAAELGIKKLNADLIREV